MDAESPKPPFRLNAEVLRMLALVGAALVLPIALVVLFFAKKPAATGAPEIPQLRASAEAAAEKLLPTPALDDGRRVVVFPEKGGDAAKRRALLASAAEKAGASLLELDGKILVTVPAGKAAGFEIDALIPPGNPAPAADGMLYEITFAP